MSFHKRAIHSSANDAEPPTSKPRIDESTTAPQSAPVLPEYVYVVIVDYHLAYGDSGSNIKSVYCSIEDANNCEKIVRDQYTNDCTNADDIETGTKLDGTVFWFSAAVGERDSADIRTVKQKLELQGRNARKIRPGGPDKGSAEDQDNEGDDDS